MSEQLLDSVKARYGAIAESELSSDNAGIRAVAEAFGYTAEELTSIPAEANMGLSCGNPTATARLSLVKWLSISDLAEGWTCFWLLRRLVRMVVQSASI